MAPLNRNEFLKIAKRLLALTGITVLAAPVIAYLYPANLQETPADPVMVGTEQELPLNSSKTVPFGRYPALIINTSEGFKAYSAVCTHFGCVVKWDSARGEIICPCHDGFFDPLDGHVISGPPPTALEILPVQMIDGKIFVGGEA